MKKVISIILLFMLVFTLSGCNGEPGIVNEGDIIYECDVITKEVIVEIPTIVYVEKEILVTQVIDDTGEITYIEIPVQLTAIATHQDYLDWLEEYEDLVDDFIDEMYWAWDDSDDIVENVKRYLETKDVLTSDEVEILLSIETYYNEVESFYEYQDEVQQQYYDLMDRFPVED